jgi:hypothetical protein
MSSFVIRSTILFIFMNDKMATQRSENSQYRNLGGTSRRCGCWQYVDTGENGCAGPLALTGQVNIGDRACCNGLRKCHTDDGAFSWCSSTGDCPGEFEVSDYYPIVTIKKNREGYEDVNYQMIGVL